MCGIFCSIARNDHHPQQLTSENCDCPQIFQGNISMLTEFLKRRGPDVTRELDAKLNENYSGKFVGSVLWTQGIQPTSQPLEDHDRNLLLWNGDVLNGPLEDSERCDSEVVFERLKADPLTALVNISGPYAFVFWHSKTQRLWFGRDVFGRQSLLWNVSAHHLAFSSVSHKGLDFSEVPSLGIFMVDLSKTQQEIEFFPWVHLTAALSSLTDVSVVEREKLHHHELGDGNRRRIWRGREPEVSELEIYSDRHNFEDLLSVSFIAANVDSLAARLSEAVMCRVDKTPGVCKDCAQVCDHCNVAVLFSGGIDSAVIALLADKFVPPDRPIDLYNVAFQQEDRCFNVPDRKTGMTSLQELRCLAPNRKWNFVEIDVSKEELAERRTKVITDLIHPLNSVLDDSIGCALWFAARGRGCLKGQPYFSPARVVLLGMGADEQLGGYTRHRATLRHQGWAALGQELAADTDNIARRNLGRDNRVVSDHGRQSRLPFLDERVVAFFDALPPWHRCFPTADRVPGSGDKLLLRLLAWKLGFRTAAKLPKRALQFGSRIANRKEKGHHVSQRL